MAGCSDNCKIEDVFSCPYIGDSDNKATISESQALQLVKQKWESEYSQADDLLGTPSYKYQGMCYHENCNCQYKEKPSYLFSVVIVNEDGSSGTHPEYLCVYNDGSLVEFFNPNANW